MKTFLTALLVLSEVLVAQPLQTQQYVSRSAIPLVVAEMAAPQLNRQAN